MSKGHKLDLLTNSISYFREAVNCAQAKETDTNQWKFAIVHVVQAMELALKERLRRIHPVFIYEVVDRPDKTVSLKTALSRLRNPQIGNLEITDDEKASIDKAVALRNELTHFEFDHAHEYLEFKFAQIFGFMTFFYRSHLGLKTEDFVDDEQHQRVIQLVRARSEIIDRAKAYVENRGGITVWSCQSCSEDGFIVEDQQCCICYYREDVLECPVCGEENLESEIEDITRFFDWDYDEGRTILHNDYGFKDKACKGCLGGIKDQIEEYRRTEYYEDMEMEYYYASKAANS
ncbi:MAG: hypothetical protein KJ017_03580 [Alphaproteobacteria bacterium]|nr:hypothetical protein [Alphaproteobacteria bacterium]